MKLVKLLSMLACAALAVGFSACSLPGIGNGNDVSSSSLSTQSSSSLSVDDSCEHDYVATVTTPTCNSMGYTTYYCQFCGDEYVGDYTQQLNHVIVIDEAVAPTCTQTGLTAGCHCDVCGETLVAQNVVPENGHREIIDEAVAPTCTQTGLTEGKHCDACGEILLAQEVIPTEAHPCDNAWKYNETHHWNETVCGCDVQVNYEEHTEVEGFCSVCELPMSSTPGLIYVLSIDGTYAEVVGYEGTFNRVKIADTYEGKPVKTIYDNAFYQKNITEVIIPDSVTTIGAQAFMYCSGLNSISIPNSVTSIGDCAFFNSGLQYVVIGNSVVSIGLQAFYACSLISVEMGEAVTSIGYEAFASCTELSFSTYGNAKYLGNENNPYLVCIEASNKNYSSYTIHEDTKVIADQAFDACVRMTSVVIGDSVAYIGGWAFQHCSRLTSVSIPDSVTYIGNGVFQNCSSLTSVTIGDSVSSIGTQAFLGCSSLTSITIPDSVTSIGDLAFYECSSLQYNEKDGLKYLGNDNNSYLYLADTADIDITTAMIDENCRFIGTRAFYYCSSLTSVTIPESVTSIGSYVFEGCGSLTSVTIGNSVTSIGGYAFYGCGSLTSIIIPDSVTSIGDWVFQNCSSLTEIKFEGTMEQWKAILKGISWKYNVPAEKVICSDGEVDI